jgi:hypothetical protein
MRKSITEVLEDDDDAPLEGISITGKRAFAFGFNAHRHQELPN